MRIALGTPMKGRPGLIISHRLATLQKADRIYVIDDDSVRLVVVDRMKHTTRVTREVPVRGICPAHEAGTHQQSIASSGIYRRPFELQDPGAKDV